MEIITVGKPAIDVYLNLVEFPMEGDVFRINKKVESVGNASATSAVMLAKWGFHVNFVGSIGDDGYADKIQNVLKEHKINTKYMETDYEGGCAVNNFIVDLKNKAITKILYSSDTSACKRFKYDFNPDWAVFDGTDIPATLGVINTNPGLKSVFYLNTINKDINNIAKKCTWIITNQNYAVNLTKATLDGSAEAYVAMYQQLVDENGQSNYIILLNNHKILYCEDGKVKMLPDLQFNIEDVSSYESIFTGAFTFGQILGMSLDESIKFANTATSLGFSKIGEVDAIPELDVILENCSMKERFEELKLKINQEQGILANYVPEKKSPVATQVNAQTAAAATSNEVHHENTVQQAAVNALTPPPNNPNV